jgi:hypothetical protein
MQDAFLLLFLPFILFFYIARLGVHDTKLRLAPNTSIATFSNTFAHNSS